MKKLLLFTLLLAGCQTSYHLAGQQNNRLAIDATVAADSSTVRWLTPYRQTLDKSMNETLVTFTERLEKKAPESALDDILADALLIQAG